MRINTNLTAMNTFTQYTKNNNKIADSVEKLSSGYAINSAADNAAGLAISEKMRAQIRGLEQASVNSQDAISLIQTAEGGLNESTEILQRMRELAVQSANDTNENEIDREALQDEFAQLQEELNNIANTTTFNKKNLLDGSLAKKQATTQNLSLQNAGLSVSLGNVGAGNYNFEAVVRVESAEVEAITAKGTAVSTDSKVSVSDVNIAATDSLDKTSLANLKPLFGFDKSAAIEAYKASSGIAPEAFAHNDKMAIFSSVLATLAIAPWAFVGFDTIPQAAEEFNFSFKKVSLIMIVAIAFGCFVYTSNNTVSAAALANWPERVMAGDWVLLIAAEELLGTFGKILIGTGVSCAVLSGIMGFYLASSRLMYSMSRDGYLPEWFSRVDEKNGTPVNAIIFCIIVSLSGPILGREALGWFVDMSAIGASMGYFFTCASTLVTLRRDQDGTPFLHRMAVTGVVFSIIFMILQLIPIPGLSGVHFCKESYIMLVAWVLIGIAFYAKQWKYFRSGN